MPEVIPAEVSTTYAWREEPESGGRTRCVVRLYRFAARIRPASLRLPVRPYLVHHFAADNRPMDVEVLAPTGIGWRTLGAHREDGTLASDAAGGADPIVIALDGAESVAWLMVVLRRAQYRRWWPVADTLDGLTFSGEPGVEVDPAPASPDASVTTISPASDAETPQARRMRLVDGWCVQARGHLLATSTSWIVRFDPWRSSLSTLACDPGAHASYGANLIASSGPAYHEAGHAAARETFDAAPMRQLDERAYEARETEIIPGVFLRIGFAFTAAGFRVTVTRRSTRRWLALRLADLSLRLDSQNAIPTVFAHVIEDGPSGRCAFPVCVHVPGGSMIEIDGVRAPQRGWVRCDTSFWGGQRLELCAGADGFAHGLHVVEAGTHAATFDVTVRQSPYPRVSGAADRDGKRPGAHPGMEAYPTALGFRPDWGVFTNNGASCPVEFVTHGFAELCAHQPPLSRDGSLTAVGLLRGALDIQLRHGGWYGNGVEDRFLGSHPSVLWACATYMAITRDRAFLARHAPRLKNRMERLFALDRDGDGIFESAYPGCGGAPGGSSYFDQIRVGHKDAISNPIAFRALVKLAAMWDWAGDGAAADACRARARSLAATFADTFTAPASGRIAGWIDAEGRMHDHAFLSPTTLAVAYGLIEGERAGALMRALWRSLIASGFASFAHGLPLSLAPIPRRDYNPHGLGHPERDDGADTFGAFLNGGVSPAWCGEAIEALHRVGMTAERDLLIDALLVGYADGRHAGGLHARRDWFAWDGTPSGYEGMLCDSFTPLAVILRIRFGYSEPSFA